LTVYTDIDAEYAAYKASLIAKQTTYAAANSGRFFQGKLTHRVVPVDGTATAPDLLGAKPHYQTESWNHANFNFTPGATTKHALSIDVIYNGSAYTWIATTWAYVAGVLKVKEYSYDAAEVETAGSWIDGPREIAPEGTNWLDATSAVTTPWFDSTYTKLNKSVYNTTDVPDTSTYVRAVDGDDGDVQKWNYAAPSVLHITKFRVHIYAAAIQNNISSGNVSLNLTGDGTSSMTQTAVITNTTTTAAWRSYTFSGSWNYITAFNVELTVANFVAGDELRVYAMWVEVIGDEPTWFDTALPTANVTSLWNPNVYTNINKATYMPSTPSTASEISAGASDDNEKQGYTFSVPSRTNVYKIRAIIYGVGDDDDGVSTVRITVNGVEQTGVAVTFQGVDGGGTDKYYIATFTGSWATLSSLGGSIQSGSLAAGEGIHVYNFYLAVYGDA
jgi:hypothetical protein